MDGINWHSWFYHFWSYNRLFRFFDYAGLIFLSLLFHHKKISDFKRIDFILPIMFPFFLVYGFRFIGLNIFERPLVNGFEFIILIVFVLIYLFKIRKNISDIATSILLVQILWPIHYLLFYRLFAFFFFENIRISIWWAIFETVISYVIPTILILAIKKSVYFESMLLRLNAASLPWRLIFQVIATIIMSVIIMSNLSDQVVLMFMLFLIFLSFYLVYKNEKLRMKEIELNYLQEVERRQTELRDFRHDHLNLISSMMKYVADEDLAGLKTYLLAEIEPTKDWIIGQDIEIGNLNNIKITELKSLFSAKLNQLGIAKIKLIVEIPDEITTINMNTMLLIRVLANLLDNAIEALTNETEPMLHLAILDRPAKEEIVIIVLNSCSKSDLSIKTLFEKGVTTKENGSGLGLGIVQKIVSKMAHVTLLTEVKDGYFKQELKIKKR